MIIYGSPGTGKSTFSGKLEKRYGIPSIDTDLFFSLIEKCEKQEAENIVSSFLDTVDFPKKFLWFTNLQKLPTVYDFGFVISKYETIYRLVKRGQGVISEDIIESWFVDGHMANIPSCERFRYLKSNEFIGDVFLLDFDFIFDILGLSIDVVSNIKKYRQDFGRYKEGVISDFTHYVTSKGLSVISNYDI